MRILIAGESWVTHSIHVKGVDSFTTSGYEEGIGWIQQALEAAGMTVEHLPGHLVPARFPRSRDELEAYDVVVLSDIGSNSLLLAPETFSRSECSADRLRAVEEYVRHGGGLAMIGGYLSFAGIEGKARFHGTPVEEALPVTISALDDRIEVPQGVVPAVRQREHPLVEGIDGEWPALLGYNRVVAKPTAEVVVSYGDDPLLACHMYGAGRSAAFTSDCAPHWGPPAFLTWVHYGRLWSNLMTWLAG